MRWIGVMLGAASGLSAGAICLLLGGEAAAAVLAVTAAGVADMLREPDARRRGRARDGEGARHGAHQGAHHGAHDGAHQGAHHGTRQQAGAGFETITSFG